MAMLTPQGDPIPESSPPEVPENTPVPQDQFNQPPQEPAPEPPPDDQLARWRQRLQQPSSGEEAIADLRGAVLVLLERAG